MIDKPIDLKFAEQSPTRVLLEEDLWALKTLSELLTSYAKTQPEDPVHFNDITKAAFLSIAKTLSDKVNERTIDYSGEKYIIMARGRRKFTLGFKREPEIYIGSEYGVNFLDACRMYFMTSNHRYNYNQRKNTFHGRMLYALPENKNKNYDLGIQKTINGGYSAWFIISNYSFRLDEVKSRGEAMIGAKMLHKAFQDLITMEITIP